MKFSVYRPDTGEILRIIDLPDDCTQEDIDLQAGEGEAIWPEPLDDTKWQIVGGGKVARAADLVELERRLLARIDRAAETVRGYFITNTESQAAVYMAKEAEALALQANPALAEGATPHLSLEAARLGSSRAECGAVILAKAAEWRAASAAIEALRLGAKDAVRAAATEAAKRAAADIDWSPVTG